MVIVVGFLTVLFAVAVIVVIVLGFLTLLFAVAIFERRSIRIYSEALGGRKVELGPYLSAVESRAKVHGLVDPSVHRHQRFSLAAMFWFSPQRKIMVHSGEGKIAGMASKQTCVYSRFQNGQVLVTTDEFDEGDPSGIAEIRRVVNGSLDELLKVHYQRLEVSMDELEPFRHPTGADVLEEIQRDRANRLVEAGRARWLDLKQANALVGPGHALVLGAVRSLSARLRVESVRSSRWGGWARSTRLSAGSLVGPGGIGASGLRLRGGLG